MEEEKKDEKDLLSEAIRSISDNLSSLEKSKDVLIWLNIFSLSILLGGLLALIYCATVL